jgi:WG repeat protein
MRKSDKRKYSSSWSRFVRNEIWGEDDKPRFSSGLAAKEMRSGKWGYMNRQRKMVIPARYDWADYFRGKFAVVREGWNEKALYGVVDKKGKQVVPFMYKTIEGAVKIIKKLSR